MKKTKSIFMAIIMFVFALFTCMAVGCGREVGSYKREYDRDGNVIVKVWSAYPLYPKYKTDIKNKNSSYYEASVYTNWIISTFEKQNPGYVIQLIDNGWGESLNTKIQTASISNTLPDLLAGEVYINKYIDLDILSPIEIDKSITDDLVPGTIRDCIKDGKTYALPIMTGAYALYYNKTVLKNAGIDLDAEENKDLLSTWEGVLSAAKTVKKQLGSKGNGFLVCNAGNLANAFQALVFMSAAGGDFLDKDGNLILNSSENIKAFNMIHDLAQTVEPGITSKSQDDLKTKFFSGDSAFMIEGSKYYATADEKELKNATCDIGVAPLPVFKGVDKHTNVISGNLCFSIIKYSPNKDIAQKFLEFLMSEEVMTQAFLIDGRIPTRQSVIDNIKKSEDENIQDVYKKTSCYIDSIAKDTLTSVPGFTNKASNIWQAFDSMMGTVVSNSTKPEDISKAVSSAHTKIKGNM